MFGVRGRRGIDTRCALPEGWLGGGCPCDDDETGRGSPFSSTILKEPRREETADAGATGGPCMFLGDPGKVDGPACAGVPNGVISLSCGPTGGGPRGCLPRSRISSSGSPSLLFHICWDGPACLEVSEAISMTSAEGCDRRGSRSRGVGGLPIEFGPAVEEVDNEDMDGPCPPLLRLPGPFGCCG